MFREERVMCFSLHSGSVLGLLKELFTFSKGFYIF